MNFEKVQKYQDSLRKQFGVRCSDCIILKNHQIIYRHLTGTADFADTKPLTENHLHDIYSASKVLTMIGVMQLIEQGKLSLDTPLSEIFPEYSKMRVINGFDLTDFVANAKFISGWPGATEATVPAKNQILIRHLMSMTAGFTYQLVTPEVARAMQRNRELNTCEIVRAWAKDPLMYEPNTRYAYSRAHDVLGAVVEIVSGVTFGAYMRKHVFLPCGAQELYYQIPHERKCDLTALYAMDAHTGKLIEAKQNICRVTDHFESGGGGIACTVESYAKVLDALANGGVAANGNRILMPESIKALSTNQLNMQQLEDFHIGGKNEYGYGLGVRTLLDPDASKSPLGEFGWDGAAGAYVLADPQNHLALFYVQAAPDSSSAFSTIHPTLRDLVYDAVRD